MGGDASADAVVDPRLRVRGTSGLRVADASVVPAAPASFLESVVTMVAEMGADLIKQDWGLYRQPPPPGFPPPPGPDPFLGSATPAAPISSSAGPAALEPGTEAPVQTTAAAHPERGQQPARPAGRPGGHPGGRPSAEEPTLPGASAKRPTAPGVDYREPRE